MDVNLELYYNGLREFNALIQFLPKFLPLVTSIESIVLDDRNMVARLTKKNFGRQLLTSARVLLIRLEDINNKNCAKTFKFYSHFQ
jgi:hypothetical protein